ncbi:MAG: HAD-IIA family hydrolase [Methylobacteriaceae bacterium]|jgi:HAD superfamily hydrolase (TIGR01450 family)|nr:HAD-IIA family hydrolase [Methylobacteriaceae bacterium]
MSIENKTCFVLDLDGTVYLGNNPIPGAVAFIRNHWASIDFYFLSNNTSKGLETYITKLNRMGIAATPERFLSPTEPLVHYLRAGGLTRAYLVGNADYTRTLQNAMPELQLTETGAELVIIAYDTELTYHKLVVSAHLLQKPEVGFVATHPDLVCPDPAGPLPDVGSFLALYEKAVNRRPTHIFGKPDPKVLAPLLARYKRENMVMVGDRLSTDKKLAENAGIDFVLVLSGEATLEDLAGETVKPWKVLNHLGEIVDSQPSA